MTLLQRLLLLQLLLLLLLAAQVAAAAQGFALRCPVVLPEVLADRGPSGCNDTLQITGLGAHGLVMCFKSVRFTTTSADVTQSCVTSVISFLN
jgi:hypothetical protein